MSKFTNILTNKITINPTNTKLTWNPIRKNRNIALTNFNNTARSTNINNRCGIVGLTGFEIGVDEENWIYNIYMDSVIYVGMAPFTQDLLSIDTPISIRLEVDEKDVIHFNLKKNYLTIAQLNCRQVALFKTKIDLNSLNGRTLHYWVSSERDLTMSVQVLKELKYTIEINNEEQLVIKKNNVIYHIFDNIFDNNLDNLTGPICQSVSEIITDPLYNLDKYLNIFDTSLNPIVAILPSSMDSKGKTFKVILQAGSHILEIQPSMGDLIEHVTVLELTQVGDNVSLTSYGTNKWVII